MPLLVFTHAQRDGAANARTTPKGMEDLRKISTILKEDYFSSGQELTKIGVGIGGKYEDILNVFSELIFVPAEVIFSSSDLGGPEGQRGEGKGGIISSTATEFANHISLADGGGWDPWIFLNKHCVCGPDQVVVLCTGKQFLCGLGKKKHFKIASVYEVLLEEKAMLWRVRQGKRVGISKKV